MSPRIYLAGPDVFHPDAAALGARKKALCRDHGFLGLFPGDGSAGDGPTIYRACLAAMQDADLGIFNLTPFRGPSADVGTVFELGFMVATGKPVFAYSNMAEDLIDRLRTESGLAFDETTKLWRDSLGMAAEDFGNADNLMIDEALAMQGRKIHRRPVSPDARFTDLDGFVDCLKDARGFLARDASS